MGQELWLGLQGLHLCPVPSNGVCTCYSLQGICFCSEKWWTNFVCRLIWLWQHLSWKAYRGLLVTNQLFLPRLRQTSGVFLSPVASLQNKPVFEAVLSLLLVGSARGLLCLHSQVYIFVHRLSRASFYSVLSSARYLLMHTFLSFAASKTADKTRSSSVSVWEGLFETQSSWDPLALLCLDRAVSASACLPSLLHCISCDPCLILKLLCLSSSNFRLFASFRSQAGTGPVAVESLLFSSWHFPAFESSDTVCNKC